MEDRSDHLSETHATVWILLLLRGAHVAGLAPTSTAVFHRLMFLSNSLASVYEYTPPSEFVLKHRRGPYYPRAQFTLERLATQGLVDLEKLQWDISEWGTGPFTHFSLSRSGRELLTQWSQGSEWCREVMGFTTDLCSALANVEEGLEVNVADSDLTYDQGWAQQYSVIPFRNAEERLSKRAIDEIAGLAPVGLKPNRQHLLRLYIKYLENVVDGS